MKLKIIVAALAIAASQAHAEGVIATFQTFDESSYGFGVNGNSTLSLWDDVSTCPGQGFAKYTVTDNRSGEVTSSGCWSSERREFGMYDVILQGKGLLPGYLFRGTDYAQHLRDGR